MIKFWKKRPAIGVGVGVGVLGMFALAARYAMRATPRQPIPDNISPEVFLTKIAQTAFGEMVYHASGTGSPLLFLHGVYPGASSFEWSKVYPSFTNDHCVIAPDLLGFGESERPRPGLDADQLVQSLADALRSIVPGEPATIVASGFGASLAVKLSAQHPELVRSLILVTPEGFDSKRPQTPGGVRFLAKLPGVNSFFYRHAISRQPFVRDWLLRYGFPKSTDIDPDVLAVITTCASQYGAEHAMIAFLKDRARYDVMRQLPRVNQPVSLIWPESAKDYPVSDANLLASMIPYCRIITHPDAAPLAALANPTAVDALIRAAMGPTELPSLDEPDGS